MQQIPAELSAFASQSIASPQVQPFQESSHGTALKHPSDVSLVTGVFPEPTHTKQMYPHAASSVARGPTSNSALNNAQFYSAAPDSSVSLNPNKFQDYDQGDLQYAYKNPSTQPHEASVAPSYTAAKDTYRDGKSS